MSSFIRLTIVPVAGKAGASWRGGSGRRPVAKLSARNQIFNNLFCQMPPHTQMVWRGRWGWRGSPAYGSPQKSVKCVGTESAAGRSEWGEGSPQIERPKPAYGARNTKPGLGIQDDCQLEPDKVFAACQSFFVFEGGGGIVCVHWEKIVACKISINSCESWLSELLEFF